MSKLRGVCQTLNLFMLLFGTLAACSVLAQTTPVKPIKLVVPFGPGGAGDITGRAFGQYLESISKQPVVIENKAGANGILGTDFVKNAQADGHTLLLTTNTTLAANLSLYKKVPYDPQKDFDHIGMFGTAASVALVLKGSGINSIADLVSYAKANPGKVFYGHYNSASQMTAELFRLKTGAPMTGVPYKAISSALQDFYGKQLQVLFVEYLPALAQIEGGKVTPLGVTAPVRYKAWPQVPAIAETYPGYELGFFLGLATPTGTTPEAMKKLEGWMTSALKDEAFQSRLNQLGLEPSKLTRPEYNKFIGTEITRWTQVIRDAGIQPE
ncbi:MAG: tripartite tricarboxylate transporter substrate binding protein [Burkholderiaceae bacterium]